MKALVLLYFILNLAATCGCSGRKVPEKVVAQVGDAVLTLEDLNRQFPREYRHLISREQYLDFVKRWIDDEIIFQDAVKRNIPLIPEVQQQLLEQKKKIVIETYLSGLGLDNRLDFDSTAIQDYYEKKRHDFVRQEKVIKYLSLAVKDHDLAWRIRKRAKQGNFSNLIKIYSEKKETQSLETSRFVRLDEIDSCIGSKLFQIRVGGTTLPLKCGDFYYIARVVDKQNAGTQKTLEEAAPEIRRLLAENRRQKRLNEKIKSLKSNIFYTYNLDILPSGSRDTGNKADLD